MLDENSYLTAIYIYVGAAGVLIVYVAWWLSRHWQAQWVTLVVLLLAALLLTPAYPKEGVDTMAPALVVAAFQYLTVGAQGAAHAIRPLVFMSGAGVVITLLLRMTVFRRRSSQKGKGTRPASGSKPPKAVKTRA